MTGKVYFDSGNDEKFAKGIIRVPWVSIQKAWETFKIT
jgi:hypothetical protein